MKSKYALLALVIGLGPALAHAENADSWWVGAGLTRVTPHDSSTALSSPSPSNTLAAVGGDTQPTGHLKYFYDNNWAVSLPLGTGFTHEISGKGAIDGVGVIGKVHVMPITLYGQYHFNAADSQVRPYVVLGASYVYADEAVGSATLNGLNPVNPPGGSTGLSVKSKWAFSAGVGVMIKLQDKWALDLLWTKMPLKTRTTLSTGQFMEATLNPSMLTVGLSYRFK